MIVDTHCHILPGVDDGAKTSKSAIKMLEIARQEGIDVMIATPHFACGGKPEQVLDVKKRYRAMQKWLAEHDSKMQIYLGSELFYSENLVEALEQGQALTINGTRYVLVEFPIYAERSHIRKAVQTLLYAGYKPIIAHAERYDSLRRRRYVEELVGMGAYIQINASSVIGKQGFLVKHFIKGLLKDDLVHFVGTDAHGTSHRCPKMQECRDYLVKVLGKKKAYRILEQNPLDMLKGEEIHG